MGLCCSDSASPANEQTSLLTSNNNGDGDVVFVDPRSPDPHVTRTPLMSQQRQEIGSATRGAASAFQPVSRSSKLAGGSGHQADTYGSLPKNTKLKGRGQRNS
jgi:hypothetical protein